MKKFFILITILSFLTPFILSNKVYASATFGFGGKIQTTKVSMVTCTGGGTLVVLTSNFTALTNATINSYFRSHSSDNKTQKTIGEITDLIGGISGTIPFYAESSKKTPKAGEQILGKADIFPDLKTCKIQIGTYRKPFPVRKTNDYNVSDK